MRTPKDVLRAERAGVVAEIAELEMSRAAIVASRDAASGDDEHDPDGSTVGFEQAQVAGLLERARARVAALDEALERVVAGTYGVCGSCGGAIGAARLEAVPEATTCVACAADVGRPRRLDR